MKVLQRDGLTVEQDCEIILGNWVDLTLEGGGKIILDGEINSIGGGHTPTVWFG